MITIDCGKGNHGLCCGDGSAIYLLPHNNGDRHPARVALVKPRQRFFCGCGCHHGDPRWIGDRPCESPACKPAPVPGEPCVSVPCPPLEPSGIGDPE